MRKATRQNQKNAPLPVFSGAAALRTGTDRHPAGYCPARLRAGSRCEVAWLLIQTKTPACAGVFGFIFNAWNQAACLDEATASLSIFCSSPDWYRSSVMSQPPISSPFTYSCGKVGQFAYFGSAR